MSVDAYSKVILGLTASLTSSAVTKTVGRFNPTTGEPYQKTYKTFDLVIGVAQQEFHLPDDTKCFDEEKVISGSTDIMEWLMERTRERVALFFTTKDFIVEPGNTNVECIVAVRVGDRYILGRLLATGDAGGYHDDRNLTVFPPPTDAKITDTRIKLGDRLGINLMGWPLSLYLITELG